MSSITNKLLTLSLNSAWQPIGHKIVKDAICDLCSTDSNGKYTYYGLDVRYEKHGGEWDFSAPIDMSPCNWNDWINLPIRDFDFTISSPSMTVRVPTIIIAKNYSSMPIKRPKLTKHNIYHRDRGVCQYTGKKLSRNQGNVDHIIPISRGGKDAWTNMVFCDRKLNEQKGCMTPDEAGLNLIREPKMPNSKPMSSTITNARHPDWKHFLP